jgi:hypothetical protein
MSRLKPEFLEDLDNTDNVTQIEKLLLGHIKTIEAELSESSASLAAAFQLAAQFVEQDDSHWPNCSLARKIEALTPRLAILHQRLREAKAVNQQAMKGSCEFVVMDWKAQSVHHNPKCATHRQIEETASTVAQIEAQIAAERFGRKRDSLYVGDELDQIADDLDAAAEKS